MKELKRIIFLIFGILFFITGILGIILPIIPGIPFFVISLFFFAKSSRKFLKAILTNKYLGKPIKNMRKYGISKKVKYTTLILLWITHSFSIYFIEILTVRIILFIILILVTGIVLNFKTKETVVKTSMNRI